MKPLFTYLLVVFFLGSCTMQKRMHRPGWHVQWNSKTRTSKTIAEKLPKELVSKDDSDVEKSTVELSEMTLDQKRKEVNSVEVIKNQSKAEASVIEQSSYGNDGPLPEENLDEVSQKEGELNVVASEKPQNSDRKSKDRRTLGILLVVLACIFLVSAIVFLTTSFGLNEFFITILIAIFGFLFLLLGTTFIARSKKEKTTE